MTLMFSFAALAAAVPGGRVGNALSPYGDTPWSALASALMAAVALVFFGFLVKGHSIHQAPSDSSGRRSSDSIKAELWLALAVSPAALMGQYVLTTASIRFVADAKRMDLTSSYSRFAVQMAAIVLLLTDIAVWSLSKPKLAASVPLLSAATLLSGIAAFALLIGGDAIVLVVGLLVAPLWTAALIALASAARSHHPRVADISVGILLLDWHLFAFIGDRAFPLLEPPLGPVLLGGLCLASAAPLHMRRASLERLMLD